MSMCKYFVKQKTPTTNSFWNNQLKLIDKTQNIFQEILFTAFSQGTDNLILHARFCIYIRNQHIYNIGKNVSYLKILL